MALSIEQIHFLTGGTSKVFFVVNGVGNRIGIAFEHDVVLKARRYHRDTSLTSAIVKLTGKSIRADCESKYAWKGSQKVLMQGNTHRERLAKRGWKVDWS